MSNPFSSTSGLRPGTTMRPGSQLRPGTNRVASVGIGGSLQQPVSVTAQAAVTREGVRASSRSGLGTSAGPGRQVGDRSYYIGLLRPRIAELSAEIDQLNAQEQLITQNSSVLTQLQQKSKLLTEEIVGLKDALAEINLAVESSGTRDVSVMQKENAKLVQENVQKRKKVDQLFLSQREAEGKIKEKMGALTMELAALDKRLTNENLGHDDFKAVREEAFAMADKVLDRQHEVRLLAAKQELIMAKLDKDSDKRRAAEMLRGILHKRRERDELEQQCALSVEEEKQLLFKSIKGTRSDIEVLERQVNDTQDAIRESKARLSSMDEMVKSHSSDNVKAYEALKLKDQEMQVFINNYPDKEREQLSKIEAMQKEIKTLLERISQALDLQRQLPTEGSPGALQVLASEVDAKQQQIENDQKTHQRLEKELMDRKTELDKVSHLDKKIKEEMELHTRRMAEQKREMERYEDLEGLRSEVDQLRKDLEGQLIYFKAIRDNGTRSLNIMSNALDARKKHLQADSWNATLVNQEQKTRMLWQSTFAIEEFVRLQEKTTQYAPIRAECIRMVEEINMILKEPSHLAGKTGPPTLNLSS